MRFSNQDLFKLSVGFCATVSNFWEFWPEFWANHLKSRLQLNHGPVHKAHSAMVTKMLTNLSAGLTCMVTFKC